MINKTRTFYMMTTLALVGLVPLGGCDPSRRDLENARQELASVTSDRDQLKGQVDSLLAQLVEAKKCQDDSKSRHSTSQQPAVPAAQKSAYRQVPPSVTVLPVATRPPLTRQQDIRIQLEANTGRNHFNR